MFKFLLGRGKSKVVKETQRQTVTRALSEVNEILAGLEDRPKLNIDLENSQIEIELPEQMPDEALALPAPESEDAPPNKGEDDTTDMSEDAKVEAKKAA